MQELQERGDKIDRLTVMVQQLQDQLVTKNNEVSMYKKWQDGDKYLRRDEEMREAIEEHQIKTMHVAEQEQKEMADAAYQAVKTL